jgi:hypothetical protein
MRIIVISLVCLVSIFSILFGVIQYDKKIKSAGDQARAELALLEEKEEEAPLVKEVEAVSPAIADKISGLDEPLAEKIRLAVENGEKVTVVAAGSSAIGKPESITPWPAILQESLDRQYGSGIFDIIVKDYGSKNSYEVIEEAGHEEIAALQPDVLIIEPFLLNDNGYTTVRDTLYHLNIIISTVKLISPDVVIYLQPSVPVRDDSYYLDQVKSLEEYAVSQNITYMNHWVEWPEMGEEEFLNYLDEAAFIPTQKGHEIWAGFIEKYFVASN